MRNIFTRLALALRMTISEIEQMSHEEIAEWQAYFAGTPEKPGG